MKRVGKHNRFRISCRHCQQWTRRYAGTSRGISLFASGLWSPGASVRLSNKHASIGAAALQRQSTIHSPFGRGLGWGFLVPTLRVGTHWLDALRRLPRSWQKPVVVLPGWLKTHQRDGHHWLAINSFRGERTTARLRPRSDECDRQQRCRSLTPFVATPSFPSHR